MLIIPPVRKSDKWGQGHYGASRGKRTHRGVDLACYPGSKILSPVTGVFTKYGFPYGDDLSYRYVQITDIDGRDHRFFYVDTHMSIGAEVQAGEYIGKVQNLGGRYEGITEHIHYEVKHEGKHIDPMAFIDWSYKNG